MSASPPPQDREGNSPRCARGNLRPRLLVAAYSGENEALEWAVESGRFGSVEHSINICDQRAIDNILEAAKAKGLGVIAKLPVQTPLGVLQNAR